LLTLLVAALLLAALACRHSAVAQQPAPEALRSQVCEAIKAGMARHGVPGVSIAVVNNYRVDWAEGFGVAAAGGSRAVTPTTLFQAASISKPVSALAALRMVELGKLGLDEDVNLKLRSWHIPDSPLLVGRPITLRQLLSHSSGLNVHGFEGYATSAPLPTLVQVLSGVPPANSEPVKVLIKPGYKFTYSGGGYSVMQLLLIDTTGIAFPDFMRQQVLEPLGMATSTYEQPLPQALVEQAACGHRPDGKVIDGGWNVHPEMAAAGLWTTPSDLAQVIIAVAGTAAGRQPVLLSPGMAAEMLKVQSGKYGLGFALRGEGESLSFSHGGANQGYRCLLAGLAAKGQGVVIMTNSDKGGELLQELLPIVSQAYNWPPSE
jgi:CubicO group peptidase (beta-lactamase class C family)